MSVRKNEANVKEIAEKREGISRSAALIAAQYMNMTGESLRSFSAKMGVSHVTMSYLLRWGKPGGEEDKAALWSLDALISLGSLLRISLANLFTLIEHVARTGNVPPQAILEEFPPRSKERLECIIRHSMKYDAKYCEETGKPFPVVLDMGELPWKCPDFVREYISGTLTDDEAYLIINHVDPFGIDPVDPYTRIKEGYMAFKSGALKAR